MKDLEYADCSRLNGAKAAYVVAHGKASLKVGEEEFALGNGVLNESMRNASALLKSRGISVVDYTQNTETTGQLSLHYPEKLREVGGYLLFLFADDGMTKIALTTGIKPLPWPEKVTGNATDLDYFKCRMLDGKQAAYHVNDGWSRLACQGEVYDCGPCKAAEATEDDRIGHIGETKGMQCSLVGKLHLSLVDDSYMLALTSYDGKLAFIKNGSLQQELDKL